jgi:hypothetical protein
MDFFLSKYQLGYFSYCVLDKEIDRYPSRNYDDTGGGKELKTIMTKNNLTDIWREKNPSVKKYTFRSGNSKSRIDLILISEEPQI